MLQPQHFAMRSVGNNPSREEKHYGCSGFREEKFSSQVFLARKKSSHDYRRAIFLAEARLLRGSFLLRQQYDMVVSDRMKSERYRLDACIQADIYLITLRPNGSCCRCFRLNRKTLNFKLSRELSLRHVPKPRFSSKSSDALRNSMCCVQHSKCHPRHFFTHKN